jgi:transposase IS66-like protein
LRFAARTEVGDRVEKRQVFDLPERPLVVTQHQASIYRCPHCRGETKAAFPEDGAQILARLRSVSQPRENRGAIFFKPPSPSQIMIALTA